MCKLFVSWGFIKSCVCCPSGLSKMETDSQQFRPLALTDSLSFDGGIGNPVQASLASPQE